MPPKKDARKREPLRINWVFRMNVNPDPLSEAERENEATILYGLLLDCCDSFAFQLESAPTTGYLHYQGFMQFTNKKRKFWILKNVHPFEYLDGMKGKVHQAWAYATKTDTRIQGPWTYGDPEELTTKKDTTYQEALAAPTVRDGLAIIKTNKPRDFCLYGATIERNLNANMKKPFEHRFKMEQFNRQPIDFNKTTHVYGPSNTGKTSFVVAHFANPLVVSHIDALKKLSPDHDGIVFDDMCFTHWPPEAAIHLVDQDVDRDLHIRYGTVSIPANTKKVFTHNTRDIFYKPEVAQEQKDAIDRRVEYLNVQNKLY